MVWAIVATGVVVVAVIVALVLRGRKGGSAQKCAGCGRNLVAGWSQCPFCGRVADAAGQPEAQPGMAGQGQQGQPGMAMGAPPQQMGGSWTVQPGQIQGMPPGMSFANGHANGANGAMAAAAGAYGQAQFGQPGLPGGTGPMPNFGAPPGYSPPPMTLPPPSPEQWAAMAPQQQMMQQVQQPQAQAGVPGQGMLEFIRGPLVGRVVTIAQARDPDGAIRIGSDQRNSIVLPDPSVSRRHAAIRQTGPQFELADLGSTNGIYVNGAKVARHQLRPGDVIRLGGSELVFK